ncbi:MAG: hypothetical protein BGP16_17970 [Sphingobium sp. 66-54]|nr:MAG: hypothetical protein BGP16_17970 [Sphingobium sp. 66-54]
MRAAHALPAVSAVLLLALPALAQGERENPTGSRIGRAKAASVPDRAALSDIDKARITTDAFADCSVTRDPRKAAVYRDLHYDDPKARQVLNDIVSSDCLRDATLRMPGDLLRGSIFKAFYRREVKPSDRSFQEKAFDFRGYVSSPEAPEAQRYLIMMDFADCVVRADAGTARGFMLAEPGSSAEKTALAALQPQLGPCFPAGVQVTLNKSIVSAILAEALYREATGARTTEAEASH